ncbi:MAG: hypothetical protein N3F07_04140 [Candidatus Micrarchaeota archaeon]|nr:hypothetical protein [Candidatus Micrarchaeota archaeon]
MGRKQLASAAKAGFAAASILVSALILEKALRSKKPLIDDEHIYSMAEMPANIGEIRKSEKEK